VVEKKGKEQEERKGISDRVVAAANDNRREISCVTHQTVLVGHHRSLYARDSTPNLAHSAIN
jgi:hypothetical protein